MVPRLATSRYPVRCVVGFAHRLEQLQDAAADDAALAAGLDGVPFYEVSREVLAEVAGFDMHRGLVAAADRVAELEATEVLDALASDENSRVIAVLEGVGDHENIGALFRNAAGLGVGAVLLGAGCADPLYRRVVRVSMGHVLRVPFAHLGDRPTTWQRGLADLQERGYRVVAMTPNTDTTLAEAVAGADKVAVMVGAEGPGLTEHAMRAADVPGEDPDVAGHGFAQCGDLCGDRFLRRPVLGASTSVRCCGRGAGLRRRSGSPRCAGTSRWHGHRCRPR